MTWRTPSGNAFIEARTGLRITCRNYVVSCRDGGLQEKAVSRSTFLVPLRVVTGANEQRETRNGFTAPNRHWTRQHRRSRLKVMQSGDEYDSIGNNPSVQL